MTSRYEYDRDRLQKYLPQLRGCAGLSAEALGQKLGITKQAVNAMEKHTDKPLTKMQYICIRAVFDEECSKNPDNLNLRDCYDMVFSDPEFYEENVARIEFAIHQAVEDTKIQKRKNRAEAKKSADSTSKDIAAVPTKTFAGTTAATMGIGGIAAATFPLMFPMIGAVAAAGILAENQKARAKKEEQMPPVTRTSEELKQTSWLSQAFEAIEKKSDES